MIIGENYGELWGEPQALTVTVPAAQSSNVALQNKHCYKVGNIYCIRTQVQILNALSNGVLFMQATGDHLHYGIAIMADTNDSTGANMKYVFVSGSDHTTVNFTTKGSVSAGWYALTYMWIAD